MPLGVKPICVTCKTENSTLWRRSPDGEILCNSCGLKHRPSGDGSEDGTVRPPTGGANSSGPNGGGSGGRFGREGTRKSARNVKKLRYKQIVNNAKSQATKGKNRRIIFKRNVSSFLLGRFIYTVFALFW